MSKKILLILGHPSENSFCEALLNAYQKGAESAGATCRIIYVSKLNFNVSLSDGYRIDGTLALEPDLVSAQEHIRWADHVVLAYPNWWGFMPAVTKGLIDRIFLPDYAFKHHSGRIFPEKLLSGKSMRIMVTMDTPTWWYYMIYRASQYQILKNIVFGYVGFKPIRFSTFGLMRKSTGALRSTWLLKVEKLGRQFI